MTTDNEKKAKDTEKTVQRKPNPRGRRPQGDNPNGNRPPRQASKPQNPIATASKPQDEFFSSVTDTSFSIPQAKQEPLVKRQPRGPGQQRAKAPQKQKKTPEQLAKIPQITEQIAKKQQGPQAPPVQKNIQKNPQRNSKRRQTQEELPVTPLKITFLGGLNEIGKNMTLFEYNDDMFVVDCGLAFPDSDMLGVDIVLPDFTHLIKNKDKIKGVILTHGHEDHIGALPYLLKQMNVPIYGTRLTLGLIEGKLKEHGLSRTTSLNEIRAGVPVQFGCMSVEPIRVNHSIPDAVAFAITTPAGVVITTGDFKIDTTPIQGEMIDLGRFAQYGEKGVLALMSDSTNAERPGYTVSERKVGDSFETLFKRAENHRIIIASFSSNIHRIQQIVDAAHKYGRKIAVSGRSMINVFTVASELGYLNVPDNMLIELNAINQYPKNRVVLITTGSQGEPLSALSRMAFSDHRQVAVGPEDFIIISATPIPGNEKMVTRVVNELMKQGCEVVYEAMYEVHVSGHACQEELKLIIGLTKPRYFIPVHGEFKHLKKHAMLAKSMGIKPGNIMISEVGKILEVSSAGIKTAGVAPSGKVFVDGLGVGDVGNIVLRDRKHLGQDGLIVVVAALDAATGQIVNGPDVVSRGFVYVREAEGLMDECKNCAKRTIDECIHSNVREWGLIKNKVRDDLSRLIYERTKRSPMILPVILDV